MGGHSHPLPPLPPLYSFTLSLGKMFFRNPNLLLASFFLVLAFMLPATEADFWDDFKDTVKDGWDQTKAFTKDTWYKATCLAEEGVKDDKAREKCEEFKKLNNSSPAVLANTAILAGSILATYLFRQ